MLGAHPVVGTKPRMSDCRCKCTTAGRQCAKHSACGSASVWKARRTKGLLGKASAGFSLALNWGAVANASKYRVQYRSATGEWTVDYDSITGTSHTGGHRRHVHVRARRRPRGQPLSRLRGRPGGGNPLVRYNYDTCPLRSRRLASYPVPNTPAPAADPPRTTGPAQRRNVAKCHRWKRNRPLTPSDRCSPLRRLRAHAYGRRPRRADSQTHTHTVDARPRLPRRGRTHPTEHRRPRLLLLTRDLFRASLGQFAFGSYAAPPANRCSGAISKRGGAGLRAGAEDAAPLTWRPFACRNAPDWVVWRAVS